MLFLFPTQGRTLLAHHTLIHLCDHLTRSVGIDVEEQVLQWMVRFLRAPCIVTSLCIGGFLHLLFG